MTTTFLHPPILVQQKLNVFSEAIQQVATLSFNKLQHVVTFVEQQMLHDVELCVTGSIFYVYRRQCWTKHRFISDRNWDFPLGHRHCASITYRWKWTAFCTHAGHIPFYIVLTYSRMLRIFLLYRSGRNFNIPPPPPPAPGQTPSIWTFENWIVQIPAPSGQNGVQMPYPSVGFVCEIGPS